MAVSEALEQHWRDAFAKESVPHRDALAKALHGVLPVESDPLRDPLFLPAEAAARRESIMSQMQAYEDSTTPCGFDDYIIKDGKHVYRADQYLVWQHRTAYDLLKRGVDVRTIAAHINRDPQWVQDIAEEYHLA